jgi:chromosome partitioning protein
MQTVLVLNTKGGCGKSTIATNLASYYAFTGVKCQLLDYDPQGSSMQWLRSRPAHLPRIDGVDAARIRSGQTRSWQMAVPSGTGRIVIDAPAGTAGLLLQDLLRRANVVLIPVQPSPVDIHASTTFIQTLLRGSLLRRPGLHVGVVCNRMRRQNSTHLEALRNILAKCGVPFVTALSDSENYPIAAESGQGIYDMDERETAMEREQWLPLLRWLIDPSQGVKQVEARPRLNMIASG